MPFPCPTPFAEPAEFARVRAYDGPVEMRTSTGGTGWLVSRYADVRALCADGRIGRSHADPGRAPRLWHAPLFGAVGDPATEMADHRVWRGVIAPAFGPGRVQAAGPRARHVLDMLLDGLAGGSGPVDLCSMLAVPYAALMVSEFAGIPCGSRAALAEHSRRLRSDHGPGTLAPGTASFGTVPSGTSAPRLLEEDRIAQRAHLSRLLEHRREGDDALSLLTRADARAAAGVLRTFDIAEHETIAARIGYGLLFLLTHPDQLRRLRHNPGLMASAVEEIIRLAVPGGSWIPRYALDDITFGDARIRAGDLVVFALQAANRDERRFRDPDVFAVDRSPNPHVGFGHGKFYCLGAHLSRLLLRTVLARVFDRFPGLRLDTPVERIEIDRRSITGGLRELPVTW